MVNGTPRAGTCPGCGFDRPRVFFEVGDIPVHSCLMMANEKEAREFPRGDVALGFCPRCGFITNLAYDPAFQKYSTAYEDQQSYSPTFNEFARRLAEHLITRYDLHGKDIVEIGCGKGDFLALLCELGDNRGVGIDPTCIKERIESEAAGRIAVIQDYYSEKYADYTGDIVVCRHTLEHIHRTATFVTTVRRGIGERLDTGVFFEVPDSLRILRDQAFWDIYYEHCSYFTPHSLANLFRRCGFEILDLALDFDDQYLLLEARPVAAESGKRHDLEEDIENLTRDVEEFAAACTERIDQWKRRFERYRSERKRIAIWGSGSKCVAFLTTLGADRLVDGIVDINPHRHHRFIPGSALEVMPPESLKDLVPDVVVVMNPVYRDEIGRMLSGMGIESELITV